MKKLRKEARDAEAAVAAKEQVKAYSLDMLGNGKKNGGGVAHQKNRSEIMERVRKSSLLTAEQTGSWEFFKTTWDKEMAERHSEHWAELFSEYMQKLLDELTRGNTSAVSVFMFNETRRVLTDTLALPIP